MVEDKMKEIYSNMGDVLTKVSDILSCEEVGVEEKYILLRLKRTLTTLLEV